MNCYCLHTDNVQSFKIKLQGTSSARLISSWYCRVQTIMSQRFFLIVKHYTDENKAVHGNTITLGFTTK